MSMKALLNAIKTDLQNAATLSYVRDQDIFIIPDEDIIPQTAAFPAIGLKDGHISMTKEATAAGTNLLWEVTYLVHVLLYVDMVAGEVPVVGQTSPSVVKGIMDINDDVRAVLHEDYQSISGILDAYCVEESAGEIIGGTDMIVLKKRLTFEYMAQEVK